jgi:hypothetical protein
VEQRALPPRSNGTYLLAKQQQFTFCDAELEVAIAIVAAVMLPARTLFVSVETGLIRRISRI